MSNTEEEEHPSIERRTPENTNSMSNNVAASRFRSNLSTIVTTRSPAGSFTEVKPDTPGTPGTPFTKAQIRKKIIEINRDKSLTPQLKSKAIQLVMSNNWNEAERVRKESIDSSDSIVSTTETGKFIQYHDESNEILGCKHYQRKCKLVAKCCGKVYPCRFCHDEAEPDHKMDRYATEQVWCMNCKTTQEFGAECNNCKIQFSKYYCDVCRFFDDHPSKEIYHCPHCNICRIGKGLGIDYFHCMKCNACMSLTLKEHKCVERSLESNCPICSCYMFTSTSPVMFLNCGHCMHVACYDDYTKTNYVCPICSKSLGNMENFFRRIDEVLEHETMPDAYKNMRTRIFCSDCEQKCVAQFHFMYHKCCHCESYNTKVLETFNAESREVSRNNALSSIPLNLRLTRERSFSASPSTGRGGGGIDELRASTEAELYHNPSDPPQTNIIGDASPTMRIVNAVRTGVRGAVSRVRQHLLTGSTGMSTSSMSAPGTPMTRSRTRRLRELALSNTSSEGEPSTEGDDEMDVEEI